METANNAVHRFYTPLIPTAGPVTSSIFVKPNGRNCVSLQLGSFTNLAIARFNLTGGGTVTATNPSYSMTALVTQYSPFASSVGDIASLSVTFPVSGTVTRATA
jgi:hypothetical protein